MTLDDAQATRLLGESTHEAGCVRGGFSCHYWLIVDGCELEHWEQHYATDDSCPCGNTFPGAGTAVVVSEAKRQ